MVAKRCTHRNTVSHTLKGAVNDASGGDARLGRQPPGGEGQEVGGLPRAQVSDHSPLRPGAGEKRLPGGEMLQAVEVAAGDGRKPARSDPREDVVAVEQLYAVDERRELVPLAEEALCRSPRDGVLFLAVRMCGDDRGTRLPGGAHRRGDPDLRRDEAAKSDCDRMGSKPG